LTLRQKNKMKVTIDGQAIEVEPGTTILQAARMIGGESVPPAMCYYSKLEEAVENAVAA
jgi:NADH-quinone oxidoreductase subunit G